MKTVRIVGLVFATVSMLLVSLAAGVGVLLGAAGLVTGLVWPVIDRPKPFDFVTRVQADQAPPVVRVGERVRLKFYEDKSVNGLWNTDGLVMSVSGLDYEPVLVEGGDAWGNSISTTSQPYETFVITGWFEVPDVPGDKPLQLTGLIHGKVTVPVQGVPSIMGNPGTFLEQVREVSVPVSFELLAADDPGVTAWEAARREIGRTRRVILLVSGALLVGSTGIYFLLRVLNRKLGLEVPTLT